MVILETNEICLLGVMSFLSSTFTLVSCSDKKTALAKGTEQGQQEMFGCVFKWANSSAHLPHYGGSTSERSVSMRASSERLSLFDNTFNDRLMEDLQTRAGVDHAVFVFSPPSLLCMCTYVRDLISALSYECFKMFQND